MREAYTALSSAFSLANFGLCSSLGGLSALSGDQRLSLDGLAVSVLLQGCQISAEGR